MPSIAPVVPGFQTEIPATRASCSALSTALGQKWERTQVTASAAGSPVTTARHASGAGPAVTTKAADLDDLVRPGPLEQPPEGLRERSCVRGYAEVRP